MLSLHLPTKPSTDLRIVPADRSPRPPRSPRPSRPTGPTRPARPRRAEPSKITSRRLPRNPELPEDDDTAWKPRPPVNDGLERIQKLLAAAGLGSRRTCEELITAGRVEVDRKIVTVLGTRIDPLKQEIRVDGERLPNPKRVVYMLNKPVGVVTTNFDPTGRPRVVDLVPGEQRLFAIGRLDRMSEGLILVTNDGELANLLSHPRYGVEKKYLVQVAGVPSQELLDKIRRGISLAEGKVHAKRVDVRSQHKLSAVLEMVLDEGKNREIRRMLARLGHKVHQLKRVGVGKLSLGNLLPSQWRPLTWSEIESLRRDAIAAVGQVEARRLNEPIGNGRPARTGRSFSDGPTARPSGDGRTARPRGGRPGQAGSRAGESGRPAAGRGGSRTQESGRPAAGRGGPRRPRKPGKASSWRKPRGGSA